MATQSPGFSRVPQRPSQDTHRVAFVPKLDKPRHRRSTSARYSWSTFSEVILQHTRFIPPSPAPTQPPPQPPLSPRHSSTRSHRRKSPAFPKHWSMKTIYNQENVDGDIAAYLQAPASNATQSSDSITTELMDEQATELKEKPEGSNRHRYFNAVIITLRRFGRNVRGGSPSPL